MQSFVARFAVIASLALALAASASGARSEPVTPTPPDAVTEAVAASPAPSGPAKVVVGAYINGLANLGFAAVYALLGASADSATSFLAAFAASLALPGLALLAANLARRSFDQSSTGEERRS